MIQDDYSLLCEGYHYIYSELFVENCYVKDSILVIMINEIDSSTNRVININNFRNPINSKT